MGKKLHPVWVCDFSDCGHEWLASYIKPRRCAKCKRYNWDKENAEIDTNYVYVVEDYQGRYKIGLSCDPDNRIKALDKKVRKVLLLEIEGIRGQAFDLEHTLHRHFATKRIVGEWFSLAQEDLDWILKCEFYHPSTDEDFVSASVCCVCHPPRFIYGWKNYYTTNKARVKIREWKDSPEKKLHPREIPTPPLEAPKPRVVLVSKRTICPVCSCALVSFGTNMRCQKCERNF